MIEIGKPKTVPVIKRVNGKLVRATDDSGVPLTKVISSEVRRRSKTPLNGSFGHHSGRKLIVGLLNGDLLSIRPVGTHRSKDELTASFADIYRWMIQSRANKINMEKLRNRKAVKQAAAYARRIKAAERRLVHKQDDAQWMDLTEKGA